MNVSWPANRLKDDDSISPEEHTFLDKFFAARSDQPLMAKWVVQHKGKASFTRRMLVVSNYRCITLKPPGLGGKLKVSKDWSFLDLLKIQVEQSDTTTAIKAIFSGGRILHIDPGMHCADVVRTIQHRIHKLVDAFHFSGRPKSVLMHFAVCTSIELGRILHRHERQGQARRSIYILFMRLLLSLAIDLLHFLDQCDYHACCDFYLVPFRGDIATKLKAAMDTTPSVADFEHCIVGMAETSKPADCGIALALLRTLQHSRHFHSVVVRGFPIGDDGISMAFQTLEQPHPVLSSIRLSNVLASRGGLQALESAAKTKHQSPSEWTLTSLDLSDNSKWAKESVVALVSAMKAFPSPLRVLNLAHCHLTHLMPLVAVLAQPSWAATLRTLDLSFNPMDVDATAALTGWLSQVKVLQHLNLVRSPPVVILVQAGTGIDTFQVINALKRNAPLYKSALMALDLSYNTLKPTTAAALGEMLETTQSFTSLVLRNVKPALASPTLSMILSPWFQNPHFATPTRASDLALSLDLSENNLSGGGGTLLADLISRSPRLRRDVLKLNQCSLHDDSLDAIVAAVAQCDSLSALHLEDNDGSPPPKSIFFSSPAVLRHAPGDAFVKLLTKQVQLKELYLSNSHPQSRYPLALLRAVVHSLGTTNSTLEVLDISGNGGGDDVAKCVAAVLPKTSCLRAL
ncbi:hypothetical protein AaE_011562, partial [Aphanomyces astaci]